MACRSPNDKAAAAHGLDAHGEAALPRPMDTKQTAELRDLGEKRLRARRLAADMTDPAVRRSLLEWAFECEARIAEIGGKAGPDRTA